MLFSKVNYPKGYHLREQWIMKLRLRMEQKPPHSPLFQLSPVELVAGKEYVQDLLKKGKIRPSKSTFGAPLFFVKNKDKPLRGVVDYGALNRITKKNAPFPRSDEMFDRLGGATVFSKPDLKTGFHQIRVRRDDIEKNAFNTKYGQFEYLVMPMGLCNAPATFQSLMNRIFYDCIDVFLVVYMDDVLIVLQCAWQAANTVRRSNRKKNNSNRNNHCRWHALRSVRHSLSL